MDERLFDCPHCDAGGILPTDDMKCTNCQGQLGADCSVTTASNTQSGMMALLFSFEGRISRFDFWLRGYFVLVIASTLLNGIFLLDHFHPRSAFFSLLLMWPWLALFTKRLHDRGRSGKRLLLLLIPFVNLVFLVWISIEVMLLRGNSETNKFGPVPVPAELSPVSKFLRIACIIVLWLASFAVLFVRVEEQSYEFETFSPVSPLQSDSPPAL